MDDFFSIVLVLRKYTPESKEYFECASGFHELFLWILEAIYQVLGKSTVNLLENLMTVMLEGNDVSILWLAHF